MESRTAPQSEKIGEETPCLPEQLIMEEILPRLPAKSLLKFRCVSKPWRSLIGSKRFIKAHLENSIKSSWFAHRCLFFDYADKKFRQCCLPSLFDKPFTTPMSHTTDLGIDKSEWIIDVGCCNGLVCILLDWKRFILWNPTTKKYKNLPDIYNQLGVKYGTIANYGFGFDKLRDDYKVFGIVTCVKSKGPPPNRVGMIYSLKSNSWKHIEHSDIISSINGEGVGMHLSGKLHWKSYKGEIVSFDLNSHLFAHVELPNYVDGVLHSVGVIGEYLSAHFFHQFNMDLDVWVMKEYGVKESWDKVTYGHLENLDPEYFDTLAPVAIAPNGEVFLLGHSTTVIYNLKPAAGFSGVVSFWGIYVESLVSVAPDAQ